MERITFSATTEMSQPKLVWKRTYPNPQAVSSYEFVSLSATLVTKIRVLVHVFFL